MNLYVPRLLILPGSGPLEASLVRQDQDVRTVLNHYARAIALDNNYAMTLAAPSSGGHSLLGVKGIKFLASQSASSDANTMDDYEEGLWTASSGTANVSLAEQTNSVYLKSGQLVLATCYVSLTNSTGGNITAVTIGGLPFTCSTLYYGGSFRHYNATNLIGFDAYSYVDTNTTNINSGGWSVALATGNTASVMYTAIYRATA